MITGPEEKHWRQYYTGPLLTWCCIPYKVKGCVSCEHQAGFSSNFEILTYVWSIQDVAHTCVSTQAAFLLRLCYSQPTLSFYMLNNNDGVIFLYPSSERQRERKRDREGAPQKYCPSPDEFFHVCGIFCRCRHWSFSETPVWCWYNYPWIIFRSIQA